MSTDDTPATPDPAATELGAPAQSASASAYPLLKYSLLRLVIFAAILGLFYVAGLRSLLLVIAALIVSGILSYFVLDRQRNKASATVAKAVGPLAGRLKERRDEEDAAAEAIRAQQAARTEDDGADVEAPGPSAEAEPEQQQH